MHHKILITGGEQFCRHMADNGGATGCKSKLRISVLVPKRVHDQVEAVAPTIVRLNPGLFPTFLHSDLGRGKRHYVAQGSPFKTYFQYFR